MKKTIGFIGCGKMASAIISGIAASELNKIYDIQGSEITEEIAKSASERLNIPVGNDNQKLAQTSDIIFIATKPNSVVDVTEEIKRKLIRR